MLRVISAVLLFGNMKFQQDRKSDQATLPDNTGKIQMLQILFEQHLLSKAVFSSQ